jgi:predicted nucleotidyltransferase
MLGKTEVREIAARFAEAARDFVDPDAVVLYGSYVHGVPHKYSDIDIAVFVSNFDDDWWETASGLCMIGYKIAFGIEPKLMFTDGGDPSGFAEHVLETGEIIYQKEPNKKFCLQNFG